MLRHSCWCSGTPIGASALLLVLRHSCWTGATTLLLRGQARPDQCFGTHAGATVLQYCIVSSDTYCAASYSFLMIGPGSQTVI